MEQALTDKPQEKSMDMGEQTAPSVDYAKLYEKIKELRNKLKKNSYSGRQGFEKLWWRNCLYYEGTQWIVWYKSRKRWESVPFKQNVPKPVTNKFAAAADAMTSIYTQKEPRVKIIPLDNSEESMATAEIGDSIIEVTDKEADMHNVRSMASKWGVLTGNAFAYSFYDDSKEHGMMAVEVEQCQDCQKPAAPDEIANAGNACPDCGSPNIKKMLDPFMNPRKMEFPIGKLSTKVYAPFQVFFNNEIKTFKEVKQIVLSESTPIEELKEKYPEAKDKITPVASTQDTMSDYYMTSLSYLSGVDTGEISTSPAGAQGNYKFDKAIKDIILCLPSKDYPEGLKAVMVGDILVEAGPMESVNAEGKQYMPVAHFGAIYSPGKVWHKAPMNDLARKQVQRNRLESIIELIVYRMGAPHWLIPTGSNVDDISGEPGQKIKYSGENKPSQVQGVPVNASIFQFIALIDKDFEELGAIFDILKGQVPKGLKATSALKILAERGFSRHMPVIRNWESFIREIKIHHLEIARSKFTEPRKKMLKGRFGDWEVREFSKSNLLGSVDVDVEAGSTLPKSQAAEQAFIMDMVQAQMINIQDPHIHSQVMSELGRSDLMQYVDKDVKDATAEFKDFKQSVEEYADLVKKGSLEAKTAFKTRFRQDIDNHMIHFSEHVMRAKEPEFFDLPEDAQKKWEEHIALHKQVLMLAQQPQGKPQGKPKDDKKREAMQVKAA